MLVSNRLTLGLASAMMLTPAVAQAQQSPASTVEQLDSGLLSAMKSGKELGFKGRVVRIGPVIEKTFDLPLMTRLAVGPGWNSIAPADQKALTDAFSRMTIAQYAGNFDSWSGEKFTVSPNVETRGSDALVRTTLGKPGGSPVALGYRLRQEGGAWKIIDVYYKNSISQIATRRSDFAGVLQKGGAKALVRHLDALADKAAD
ncbi:hypothetical protein GCM10023219_31480 [Stakelama sediminis]|uniref:Phospholipid transport system substrate-binding protein n=1 Tax=Stakelama sediminis TaxID=463200 RepID=A0A840Z0L0_9SPHN|nr:ABC transporter substrate-binding protein [Stakelama sediminis]MBB5719661.1 phospholipid transport system substrate-binding protein [Stakelama sediminis]